MNFPISSRCIRNVFATPLAAVLVIAAASAQFPYLLTDADMDGTFPENRTIEDWSGTAVFPAKTTALGVEPWISDGTPAGTHVLLDINPGPGSSVRTRAMFSVELNGYHYFAADDGVHGSELWRSDGTVAGTSLVADIEPGPGGSFPALGLVNGKLVIYAYSTATGAEPWVSDGTTAGTHLLVDVAPGSASSFFHGFPFSQVSAFGNLGFFAVDDGVHGFEPWITDGTTAGTFPLADVNPGAASGGGSFVGVLPSGVLFAATTATEGRELWRTDGTPAGTQLVMDINPGAASSNPTNTFVPAIAAGQLFLATTPTQGTELWISDGTPAGTHLVREFTTGLASTQLIVRALDSTRAILGASTPATGFEPWVTDGTFAGTVPLEIVPGPLDGSIYTNQPFFAVPGRVFFLTQDPFLGSEVGVTDGTPSGTYLVKDLVHGAGGINLPFVTCDDFVFFYAPNGSGYSNGTAATTQLLRGAPGVLAPLRIIQGKHIGSYLFLIGYQFPSIGDIRMFAMHVDVDGDANVDLFDDLAFATGCSCTAAVAPCANSSPSNGCANTTGLGARIDAAGSTILANDDLVLNISQLPASTLGILFMGATQGTAIPFRDGVRCVTGSVTRWPVHAASAAGTMSYGPGLAAQASALFSTAFRLLPATTWSFQAWYRDNGGPCGTGSNLSNSGTAVFRP